HQGRVVPGSGASCTNTPPTHCSSIVEVRRAWQSETDGSCRSSPCKDEKQNTLRTSTRDEPSGSAFRDDEIGTGTPCSGRKIYRGKRSSSPQSRPAASNAAGYSSRPHALSAPPATMSRAQPATLRIARL